MEPGWVPEWEPGWELEWEPDWEAGWEPDWEPGWKPEWEPNWDQTGTKLAPNEGPLEALGGPLGPPWSSLGGPLGYPRGPGTGPAPVRHRGPQKVLKVCNCRQKPPGGKPWRHAALPDFGTP